MQNAAGKITVGGTTLRTGKDSYLLSVNTQASLDTPVHSCQIVVSMGSRLSVRPGTTVQVELGYGNESSRVFTGRVQSVDAGLSQIHIEALSDFSALIKARVNLVYEKQTAGAIVENLLGRFNIEKSKVEPGINFPSYTLSAGRTAWANLRQLAEQCGFDFYADVQDQAVFAAYRPAKTHEFQYGSHILDYTWASLADAFVGVEVCGESPSGQGQGNDASVWLTKKEVKGTAGRTRGKVLRLVDPTARTPSMAREIAGNQWQRYKAQAKGQLSLLGTPEVGLGDAIQLSKMPPAHRGQLRVTGVRHRLNSASGFLTDVSWEKR